MKKIKIQLENGESMKLSEMAENDRPITLVQMADGTLKSIWDLSPKEKVLSLDLRNLRIKTDEIKSMDYNNFTTCSCIKTKSCSTLLPEAYSLLKASNKMEISKIGEIEEYCKIAFPKSYPINSEYQKVDLISLPLDIFLRSNYKKYNEFIKRYDLTHEQIAKILKISRDQLRNYIYGRTDHTLSFLLNFAENFNLDIDLLDIMIKGGPKSCIHLLLPKIIDKNISYIDGVIRGDGHILKDLSKVIITCYNKEYGNNLLNIIKSTHKTQADYDGKRLVLYKAGAMFYHYIMKIPTGKKGRVISFSNNVLRSPNDVIIGELRGILETDGNIHMKRSRISFSTTSWSLGLGITSAALRLGIAGTIFEGSDCLQIVFEGTSCKQLINRLDSLIHPNKNNRLQNLKKKVTFEMLEFPAIGRSLRKARLTKNLTQSKLANIVGTSFQKISKYEKGNKAPYSRAKRIYDVTKDPELKRILLSHVCLSPLKVVENGIRLNFPRMKLKEGNIIFVNNIPVSLN